VQTRTDSGSNILFQLPTWMRICGQNRGLTRTQKFGIHKFSGQHSCSS